MIRTVCPPLAWRITARHAPWRLVRAVAVVGALAVLLACSSHVGTGADRSASGAGAVVSGNGLGTMSTGPVGSSGAPGAGGTATGLQLPSVAGAPGEMPLGGAGSGGAGVAPPSNGGASNGGASNGGASTGGTSSGGSTGGAPEPPVEQPDPPPPVSCKRGVAYGEHSAEDLQALSGGVSWWYNWTYRPEQGTRASFEQLGVEFAPMIWSDQVSMEDAAEDIPESATALLGYNEPNFNSQAAMTAQEAASHWPVLQQLADQRGLRTVSPAVNFCDGACSDTDPFNYLHQFFDACGAGCRVDVVAMHIYVGCNAEWLIEHMERYKAEFSQPLWLTEFACHDAANVEQQRQFMVDAVAYLENEPRVERYSWFAGRTALIAHADLLGASGELTSLGETYVGLPHSGPCVP